MKKLQSNFTTPEQSKRLLELGVPAWTADLYFYEEGCISNDDEPSGVIPYGEVYEDNSKETMFSSYVELPCWSVGRLIELYMKAKGLHNDDTATLTGYRSAYYLIDAEPIPLTPEILEKNGFEKEGVMELYNLYAGIDHRVTIHDDKEYMNSNSEWYVHVDSEDYSTIAGCELTYVHELQHILRLCKIDKEIVV